VKACGNRFAIVGPSGQAGQGSTAVYKFVKACGLYDRPQKGAMFVRTGGFRYERPHDSAANRHRSTHCAGAAGSVRGDVGREKTSGGGGSGTAKKRRTIPVRTTEGTDKAEERLPKPVEGGRLGLAPRPRIHRRVCPVDIPRLKLGPKDRRKPTASRCFGRPGAASVCATHCARHHWAAGRAVIAA